MRGFRTRHELQVYVVVASAHGKVSECAVLTDVKEATGVFKRLRDTWGDNNVCMAARKLNDLPLRLKAVA